MVKRSLRLPVAVVLTILTATAVAVAVERGVLVRQGTVYLSPDQSSPKLASMQRGREVVVLESSRDWLHITTAMPSRWDNPRGGTGNQQEFTGWLQDKGVVRASTPNGDEILYGEAVDSEHEASRPHGRRGADRDAFRLYGRTAELFPNSPRAPEALYRAADVLWQLDRADMLSRPSAKERDPAMRHHINEDLMREVMKKYHGTKWADLAAYHLIDNQLCLAWQEDAKCAEKDAGIYERYAAERPQSPAAPEALYEAAKRRAALIDIFQAEKQSGKFAEAKSKAIALTQRIAAQYAQGDWAPRARTLQYEIEQGLPTYGAAATDTGVSEFKP